MKIYSISDIEALTGIRAHTLRIWEQRYSIFLPKRTESNIRYYDEDDLRLLLNISTLNDSGYKISKIAKMTSGEIVELVQKLRNNHAESDVQVRLLSGAVVRFDEAEVESILTACIREKGFVETMHELVFPLLKRIGFMWKIGLVNAAHEQFIMHLICSRIICHINSLSPDLQASPQRYLLFLPEGEFHEAGLLFAKYLLKAEGYDVLYLGANFPAEGLSKVIENYQPDALLSVVTPMRIEVNLRPHLQKVVQNVEDISLILVGVKNDGHDPSAHPQLSVFSNLKEFQELILADRVSLAS